MSTKTAEERAGIRTIGGYVVARAGAGWMIYPPLADQAAITRDRRSVKRLAGRGTLVEVREWISLHPAAVTFVADGVKCCDRCGLLVVECGCLCMGCGEFIHHCYCDEEASW